MTRVCDHQSRMISVSRGFLTGVVVGVEDDEVLAVATLTDGWSGGGGRSGVGSR